MSKIVASMLDAELKGASVLMKSPFHHLRTMGGEIDGERMLRGEASNHGQ